MKPSALGVLGKLEGKAFAGSGFNTIFRPQTTVQDPNGPKITNTDDNVLGLNLTTETLSFTTDLGGPTGRGIPNRGFNEQADIFLNGLSYVQTVTDVTTDPSNIIHFEPGIWLRVPESKGNPQLGATLCRMASIPHGTTINAQGLESASETTKGKPTFPKAPITPSLLSDGSLATFGTQTIDIKSAKSNSRLPGDLTSHINAKTITQDMVTDPNTVLSKANDKKNIIETTKFKVSTAPVPRTSKAAADVDGGAANIAFLQGTRRTTQPGINGGPNASAVKMESTFWVATLEHQIDIPGPLPKWIEGQQGTVLHPVATDPDWNKLSFEIRPKQATTGPKSIKVNTVQVQYSQTVVLNFNGLSWPHVSVATLLQDTQSKTGNPIMVTI